MAPLAPSASLAPPSAAASGIGIAAVERDTGVNKETLRVWERRYGFPQPLRDAGGERLYPPEQVERLRLVKRLIDQGMRPGKLLGEPVEALKQRLLTLPARAGERIAARAGAAAVPTADDVDSGAGSDANTNTARDATHHGARQHNTTADDDSWVTTVLTLLKRHDVERLRAEFGQRLAREGLRRFVIASVPPLNCAIGEAWLAGEIAVFEEHLYTELMQNQLRAAIFALPRQGLRPQVLLTTLKDEEHQLGLLMAEALLCAEGAWCLSLGAQTPVSDIVGAATGTTTDIVALSFSSAYSWRKARDALLELRAALPPHIALWAGGTALAERRLPLPGVCCIGDIGELPAVLAAWHTDATRPRPAARIGL